ncbi:MAG: 6,7-dimethyl-8-ribityllumazine synthase [Bacteroidetes bacterium]|nr:6,7-dimethyl-8-ribityllumazine synthase [Bacteroidota bacterium]MCH8524168.1 6,7-dimethyl-8-ribityllumazine synthase [Balneolales bacterium]
MSIQVIEGDFRPEKFQTAIVVSRWNSFITERLKEGALEGLKRHGVSPEDITVVYCPGSFEIPLTAKQLLETGKYDGIITIGTVIKGATAHFDYVCSAVTNGVARLNLDYGKPVIFGVLTTDTIEQAIERAGTKAGNKGEEAAMALIEMVSLRSRIG